MSATLRALTIRQPWAWAIVYADKDVENRSWSTSYRGPLLIHAANTVDHAALAAARDAGWHVPDDLPRGALVGEACLVDCIRDANSPWAEPDRCHWLLSRRRAYPRPILWPGARRLFTVPATALRRLEKGGRDG